MSQELYSQIPMKLLLSPTPLFHVSRIILTNSYEVITKAYTIVAYLRNYTHTNQVFGI